MGGAFWCGLGGISKLFPRLQRATYKSFGVKMPTGAVDFRSFSTGFSQAHLKKDCPCGSPFQGLLFEPGVGLAASLL